MNMTAQGIERREGGTWGNYMGTIRRRAASGYDGQVIITAVLSDRSCLELIHLQASKEGLGKE